MLLSESLFPFVLPIGITYLPDYVTDEQAQQIVHEIDIGPWDTTYRRRRKHFGQRYKRGSTGPGFYPGPLPKSVAAVTAQVYREGLMPRQAQSALINEYLPGQGISAHIDAAEKPGGIVASLSLGSSATMQFCAPDGHRHCVFLERNSLILIQGPPRDCWTHAIPARQSDTYAGLTCARGRRISVTFRSEPE